MTTLNTINLNSFTLSEKRQLLSELKSAIKADSIMIKQYKINQKVLKEAEKKSKVMAQIKAAEEKLAKLTAKLAG